ncbi:MAG: hypothetical protein AB8B51_14205 [Sedimentitalea sp.]
MILATGTFMPCAAPVLRGSFNLNLHDDGLLMETSADFFFAGANQPAFALARGVLIDATDPVLHQDVSDTRFLDLPGRNVPVCGQHCGLIPPSGDVAAYTTVVLWCFQTSLALGFGQIERARPANIEAKPSAPSPVLELTRSLQQ